MTSLSSDDAQGLGTPDVVGSGGSKEIAAGSGTEGPRGLGPGGALHDNSVDVSDRPALVRRLAARSLSNSKSALGAFYRRLRARIGAPKAITATAYKIAKLFYLMLKTRRPYQDIGQAAYDERFRARRVRSLQRMATELGFQLLPANATV